MSQARVERERIYQALDGAGLSTALAGSGVGATLGTTMAIETYPTVAIASYAIAPQTLDGTQEEGAVASYGPTGAPPFLAVNVGSKVPPSGTPVLCVNVGGYWVFRYDG